MREPKPPFDDITHAWTHAEREVWNAWSKVEQDVSGPETAHACGQVLDALEASAQGVARVQSAAVHGALAGVSSNPFLPTEAKTFVEQACRPLLSFADLQPHLVSAWFGMARQMALTVRGSGHYRHPM